MLDVVLKIKIHTVLVLIHTCHKPAGVGMKGRNRE